LDPTYGQAAKQEDQVWEPHATDHQRGHCIETDRIYIFQINLFFILFLLLAHGLIFRTEAKEAKMGSGSRWWLPACHACYDGGEAGHGCRCPSCCSGCSSIKLLVPARDQVARYVGTAGYLL